LKFSRKTSAPAMSLRSTARPRASLRLSTTLRLFGFTQKWADPSPLTALSQWRTMSPPGGSTLITSAPKSARWRSPSGPLIDTPSETTRTPSRGSTIKHLKIPRSFPAKSSRHHIGQGPADPCDHWWPETRRGRWHLRSCTVAPQARATPASGRDHAGPYDTLTVSLGVTYAVACTYGCDGGRTAPTRCA